VSTYNKHRIRNPLQYPSWVTTDDSRQRFYKMPLFTVYSAR